MGTNKVKFHWPRIDFSALKDRKRRHALIMQFVKYNMGGNIWFLSGYGAFALFYSVFDFNWLLAKLFGDTVGFMANYFVQRYWAFASPKLRGHNVRVSVRYSLLMVVHIVADYIIVGGLYEVFGITPYIGAFVASSILTMWNYLWFKFFVFSVKG